MQVSHFAGYRYRLWTTSIILCLALWIVAGGARAAPSDAAEVVRGFYSSLLATMKDGPSLGPSGRYHRLDPIVRRAFDVAFMTRLAVGPNWSSLSSAQQQELMGAFERYVAATYADRFDSYSGERLEITGQKALAGDVIVETGIVKSNGERIGINYLMHRNGEDWQIADVYLDGSISELATRRSEFSSILRDRGIGGLIAALNKKSELLAAIVPKAS
jgi:phospholipid transport system substrate-binding protein